jgi:hypothetical protein
LNVFYYFPVYDQYVINSDNGEMIMKLFTVICLLLLPAAAMAQQPQGMDIQKMMEQAQAMQKCMQSVDQAELEKFQQRAMEVNKEIKSLCAAGKRDEAQSLAISFGKEAAQNKAMQEMEKCGEMAKDFMPGMSEGMSDMPETHGDIDYSKQHVCDNLGD